MANVTARDNGIGDQFRTAMRTVASTVFLITTTVQHRSVALLATSVTSLSVDPPTLLVCINRMASIHNALGIGAQFCANVLAPDDLAIAQHCVKAKGCERFAVGDWRYDEPSAPWLASAPACIFASVVSITRWHTHSVVFGNVTSASVNRATGPLLYADGSYGTSVDIDRG
jgi:flavin reductase (DIM6/NTAB) family NADH-FMN oxidoreductase RutF